MMELTKWFGLFVIITGTYGITIYKECIPRREWEFVWEGSHIELTFWLPEETTFTSDYSKLENHLLPPLSFILQFRGTSMPKDYDRIEVRPSRANIYRVRNKISEEIIEKFQEPLESGWNTLNFTSTPSVEVWHWSSRLLSFNPGLTIDKVSVIGSNTTINCRHLTMTWPIKGENEVGLPLLSTEQEHRLTLYSNMPTKPVLHLASSEALQLGWDGSNLADQTNYRKEVQSPMLPSVEHKIVISCRVEPEITCDVLVGFSKKKIKTFHLENLPKELSVVGGPTDELFVFYHLQRDPRATATKNRTSVNETTGTPASGSNDIVYIAVIAILLLLLAGIVGWIVYNRHFRKGGTRDARSVEENQPMLESKGSIFKKTRGPDNVVLDDEETIKQLDMKSLQERKMLAAIERDDLIRVQRLLKEEMKIKPIYEIQAHFLGRKKILQAFQKHNEHELSKPSNEMILSVFKELESKTKDIFKAAELGRYEGSNGVRSKLHDSQLPHSVTDERGRSILHYTSAFREDELVWKLKDVTDFLKNCEYFINAVDYEGNTVLHVLANNHCKHHRVQWGESELYLAEVAMELAKLFISYGADPNIKNHKNILSQELAKKAANLDLEKLLEEQCKKIGGKKKNPEGFEVLLEAVRTGNTERTCKLLLDEVPMLPMSAEVDPLVEAMRNNQLATVFLLLSAGSPICNRSIEDLSPLEAAHNTLELPACYAAIMRKVFCDRLTVEKSVAQTDHGSSLMILSSIIGNHIKSIKNEGKEAEGNEPRNIRDNVKYSKWIRNVLVKAANNGLSLTCLLLGQKDSYLHPLPAEENPFDEASTNRHYDTQFALCRDLDMVPFSCKKNNMLPDTLLKDMYSRDFYILQKNYASEYRSCHIDSDLIDKIRHYENDFNVQEDCPVELLYLIAKYDLVSLLNKIVTGSSDFQKDQIIEEFSSSTMLHVAAMYGNLRVIEYLIYNQASLSKVTLGNLTAAHLAAIGGHKECFHYIQAWMEVRESDVVGKRCHIGLTASELMDKYEGLCKVSDSPLMSHDDALCVKNEIGDDKKVHEILFRKGKKLNICNFPSLVKVAQDKLCDEDNMQKIRDRVKAVTIQLCNSNNKFIKGELTPHGPLTEGNELLEVSHVDFIYQITEEVSSDDVITTITETFPKSVEKAMENYQDKSGEFSLAPPFLTRTHKGINIRWIWKTDNQIKLLTTYIVPTVMPDNGQSHSSYDRRLKLLVPSSHKEDHEYFSKLIKEEKQAWLTCRLLRKLTQSCWWSPPFKNQYYPDDWHTRCVGVGGLSETTLKKFFKDKNSVERDVFSRIMKTYEDIAEKDSAGQWVPKTHESCTEKEILSVCGILQYLEYLKNLP